MIENKMNRRFNFALLHALMSHGLTAMVGVYFFIKNFNKPNKSGDDAVARSEYEIAD